MGPGWAPPLRRGGKTWSTGGARLSAGIAGMLDSVAVMMADGTMDPIATPSGESRQQPQIVTREDGATIAYHRLAGKSPGIVFLGGFLSDMNGTKATALEGFCRARGPAFLRFGYFGHGAASGAFAQATIGRWREGF